MNEDRSRRNSLRPLRLWGLLLMLAVLTQGCQFIQNEFYSY